MAKVVICVRHPEKEMDADGIYPGDQAGVSERGERQAGPVIERLRRFSPKAVMSSEFPRAVWLAERIAASLELPYDNSHKYATFNELDKPQSLVGTAYTDPRHVSTMQDHRTAYPDNCARDEYLAREAFRIMEEAEGDPLVIVGHAKRIASYLEYCLNFGSLKQYYLRSDPLFDLNPTGLTTLTRKPGRRPPHEEYWHISTVNDISHIQENS